MMKTAVFPNENHSAFPRAALDASRNFWRLARFAVSALSSAALDLGIFTLLTNTLAGWSTTGILAATVLARCTSGAVNFTLNKKWCFASRGHSLRQAGKYLTLFGLQMLLSWSLVTLVSRLPVNLTVLKLLVDGGLSVLSYLIQRDLVFKDKQPQAISFPR